MRKVKEIGEVAVIEMTHVGVRTRARTLAMAAASTSSTKKRKVDSREFQLSSSCVQLRSRRKLVFTTENQISPASSENSGRLISSNRCSSQNSDHIPASRCSSNGSSELVNESLTRSVVDLEGEEHANESSSCIDCRERRERTPSSSFCAKSDDLESMERPSVSRHRSIDEKTPSKAEIDEFFSTAEKEEQKRFAEKFNYDIAKDVPLKGRYEWVRLKP